MRCWLQNQLNTFITTIKKLCYHINDGLSISALFEQSIGLWNRMEQIGANFTSMILAEFHNILTLRLTTIWETTVANLKFVCENEKYYCRIDNEGTLQEEVYCLFVYIKNIILCIN